MNSSRQIFTSIALIALVTIACTSSSSAVPITYVFTGTASGCFAPESCFEDATLTVTAVGDTNNVTFASGVYNNPTLSTTIAITGFDPVTVIPGEGNHDYVFDNQNPFEDTGEGRIGYGITGLPQGTCCDIIQ